MWRPNHHPFLQDYFRWESQSSVQVVANIATDEKAAFMPVGKLKAYFEGHGRKNLNGILSELSQRESLLINPVGLLRTHTAVFCILLHISQGQKIEHFSRYIELSDQRLPFDPACPPAHFPTATNCPNFLLQFCEKQWMYCVPTFEPDMLLQHFRQKQLLPITQTEKIGVDKGATTYKVKIYKPYNKLIPDAYQIQIDHTDSRFFILKSYFTEDAEKLCEEESRGFNRIRHSDGIAMFYGSYRHGDNYNLLLEFPDRGSLEDYFRNVTPPSCEDDTIKFWAGLFELIKALENIHSKLGCHRDIKPTNVQVLTCGANSPFDWRFKFANLGWSPFATKGDTVLSDSQSTLAYSAPECYIPSDSENRMGRNTTDSLQNVDIWSLGCIYSEAAIWLAFGYKGVLDYRQLRMAETNEIPNFRGGDCFHDGKEMLKAVASAHGAIKSRFMQSSDIISYIIRDVLGMVGDMLWHENRQGARAFSRKAQTILSEARQTLSSVRTEDTFPRTNNNPISLSHRPGGVWELDGQPTASQQGPNTPMTEEFPRPSYSEESGSGYGSVSEHGSQIPSHMASFQGISSPATTPNPALISPFSGKIIDMHIDIDHISLKLKANNWLSKSSVVNLSGGQLQLWRVLNKEELENEKRKAKRAERANREFSLRLELGYFLGHELFIIGIKSSLNLTTPSSSADASTFSLRIEPNQNTSAQLMDVGKFSTNKGLQMFSQPHQKGACSWIELKFLKLADRDELQKYLKNI